MPMERGPEEEPEREGGIEEGDRAARTGERPEGDREGSAGSQGRPKIRVKIEDE